MNIVDYFKIPEKGKVDQRVYVKDVVAVLSATGHEKALLEKTIDTIHLVGVINEDNSGIWTYEDGNYMYEEIQVFYITLKNNLKVKMLNEEIQKAFPNPIIVIYQYGDELLLSTAMKRLNKIEKEKVVIDSIQITDWFKLDLLHHELLNKISYQKKNLKEFYESIDYILSAEYIAKAKGSIPEIIDFTVKTKSLAIQQLLEEKNKYINQEKEESSMQGKMNCHMKIKEIEKKIELIK